MKPKSLFVTLLWRLNSLNTCIFTFAFRFSIQVCIGCCFKIKIFVGQNATAEISETLSSVLENLLGQTSQVPKSFRLKFAESFLLKRNLSDG